LQSLEQVATGGLAGPATSGATGNVSAIAAIPAGSVTSAAAQPAGAAGSTQSGTSLLQNYLNTQLAKLAGSNVSAKA
jgi:hypothetical protein